MTRIEDILEEPDYVGINPNEKSECLEYIKVFDENILVAIKYIVQKNSITFLVCTR